MCIFVSDFGNLIIFPWLSSSVIEKFNKSKKIFVVKAKAICDEWVNYSESVSFA